MQASLMLLSLIHYLRQVKLLSFHWLIEIKGLNHHLLCLMQCDVNGVLIDEAPKFLAPIPSETMNAIQIENPFDATHPLIIPFKLNGVTSYFEMTKPTQEDYEDQIILKIELRVEAPLWDLSRSENSQ